MRQEQKEAKPTEKIVKVINETIGITESAVLTKIYLRWGNKSIRAVVVAIAVEGVITVLAAFVGYFIGGGFGLAVGIVIPVAASAVNHTVVSRKLKIEVRETSRG